MKMDEIYGTADTRKCATVLCVGRGSVWPSRFKGFATQREKAAEKTETGWIDL
jgi:hypothetical protein